MSKIAVITVSDKKYLFHFETFYKSFMGHQYLKIEKT